jgi:DNA-binding transcriptional regulator YiaG
MFVQDNAKKIHKDKTSTRRDSQRMHLEIQRQLADEEFLHEERLKAYREDFELSFADEFAETYEHDFAKGMV